MARRVRVAGDGDCFFHAVAFSLVNAAANTASSEGCANLVLNIAQRMSRLPRPIECQSLTDVVAHVSRSLRMVVAYQMLDPFDTTVVKYRAGLEEMYQSGHLGIGDVASDYFWVDAIMDHRGRIDDHKLWPVMMNKLLYQGDDMTIEILQRALTITIIGINLDGAPIQVLESVSNASSGVVFLLKSGAHYDACHLTAPTPAYFPKVAVAQNHYERLVRGLAMPGEPRTLLLGSL